MIAQRALKNEYPHKKFHPGLRRSDKVEGDDATAEDKPPLKEQLVDSAESDEKGNVQLRDPNTPAAPAQPSPAPAAPNQPSPNTPAAAAQASPNIAPAAPVVPPTPKSVSYECAFCEGTTEAFDKV